MTVVMGLIIVDFAHLRRGRHAARFQPVHGAASVGGAKIGAAQEYRMFAYDRAIQQYRRQLLRHAGSPTRRRARVGLDPDRPAAIAERRRRSMTRRTSSASTCFRRRTARGGHPRTRASRDKSGAFESGPASQTPLLRDMDMNERGFISNLRKQAIKADELSPRWRPGVTAPRPR